MRRRRPAGSAPHAPDTHHLIGPYVCDALGDRERAAVEAHLDACPECAEEVEHLRATAAVLAVAVSTAPPPQLHTRIRRALIQPR